MHIVSIAVVSSVQVDLSTGFPVPLGYYRGGTSEGSLLRSRHQRAEQYTREHAAESALDTERK